MTGRRLRAALMALLLLALCLLPARADAVTDTISIYVGYFGFSEDQYVEKATYHWTELDDLFGGALPTQEVVYSYTNGSRTYLAAARGFYIRDLLDYAGIDFPSIASLDFFTMDHTAGAYRSFTKASLFDLPRYFFPNLAIDEQTQALYAYDGGDLWDGAVQVEAMLALEDYTQWDAVGSEFAAQYDSSMFSASSRFHLFFGQADPTEASTSSAAKYIYKIFVTFSGVPVLTADETNLELKVGSQYQIALNVAAEDSLLDAYVRQNLTWATSDPEVATVDAAGSLTLAGEGTAVITASFGAAAASVTVVVTGDGEAQPEAGPIGDAGIGETAGAVSGDGASWQQAGAAGDAEPESEPAADPSTASEPEQTPQPEPQPVFQPETSIEPEPEPEPAPAVQPEAEAAILPQPEPEPEPEQLPEAEAVYTLPQTAAESLRTLLEPRSQTDSQAGGLDNARTQAMDPDAQQLVLQLPETPAYAAVIFGCLGGVFALGFFYGILRYLKRR